MRRSDSKLKLVKTDIQVTFDGPYGPVYEYLVGMAGGKVQTMTVNGPHTTMRAEVPLPQRIYWDLRYFASCMTLHEQKDAPLEMQTLSLYVSPGGALLDFGCGVGRHAPWLAENADYFGVDPSEQALIKAQKGYKYFLLKDHLPFRDGIFQTVFSCQVLKHILDDEELKHWISEMARVTAPHGHHVHYDITWMTDPVQSHLHLRPKTELLKLFNDAGIVLETDDWAHPDNIRTVFYGVKE